MARKLSEKQKQAFYAGRERYLEQQRAAKTDTEYAKYIRRLNAIRKRQNKISGGKYINTTKTLSQAQFKTELARSGSIGKVVNASLGLYSNEKAHALQAALAKHGVEITFEQARNPKAQLPQEAWNVIKEYYHSQQWKASGLEADNFAAHEFFGS